MSGAAVEWTWVTSDAGTPLYERCMLGRVTVIVWTGDSYADPAGGHEVCDAYVPTTDREYPDGFNLVRRRPLETLERAVAKIRAVDAARDAAISHGKAHLIA